jgi:hypothetical protein
MSYTPGRMHVPFTRANINANTTAQGGSIYLCDAGAGGITVTLPPAASAIDQMVIVKKTLGIGSITVEGDGAETIDGVLNKIIATQYSTTIFLSDGAGWQVLNQLTI